MANMTQEEQDCYSQRYSDVGSCDPREHYVIIGKDQGRLKTCAKELTNIEANTYVIRHADIEHKYGINYNSNSTLASAKKNYTDFGYK